MKIAACFVLLAGILAPCLIAQTREPSSITPPPHLLRISAGVAEKLLIHKVEPVLSLAAMEARGTIVVVIEIGRNGDVLHPRVISGQALLSNPVLDAVRKYKYKPYLINGKAVEVETTVSVTLNY
jgi:protein TonB